MTVFSVELAVRGYEIDAWGHTNNAVYLNWLEYARWEMAQTTGFTAIMGELLPVVRRLELDFRNETKMGDIVRVSLWPRSVSQNSMVFGGAIRILKSADEERSGRFALTSTMVLTCIKRGVGKVPVPDPWRSLFPAVDPGAEPPAEA